MAFQTERPIATINILGTVYNIYKDGCVYDREAQEIPQEIFEIRDILINLIKINN